ncbi:DNA-binding NtrC family response regulator [Anaerosolibacter carboniphilus]|uniref:Stage 0 sporulation protein A homolog n=1 Tax=Anaerosolibacter carboniphilus TaxID=1417629 RepID=A0A841KXG1_9FIRM|nr:response regulator [Anaerosolibacter carboniphilus]MBB6218131.1 DNA-binding NtrC family response regulator [Anaerosolibacter carboniphilus]
MKKVLVADDTKNIRSLLSTCLKHEGFVVVDVENGEEALEAFHRDVFDLAFLDIKMPKISGTEVLRRIRELGIQTPVIVITAFATIKNAVECTQLGAVAYLQKPFTTNRIKQVLAEIMEMSNQHATVDDLLQLSNEKINHGNLEGALIILKQALSMEPTNSKVYEMLSKAYGLLGNVENAEKFSAICKLLKQNEQL